MIAGATSTICTNPLWVIKTRFMVRVFSPARQRLLVFTIEGRHNRAARQDTAIH
jgi:hypothetical protein